MSTIVLLSGEVDSAVCLGLAMQTEDRVAALTIQ